MHFHVGHLEPVGNLLASHLGPDEYHVRVSLILRQTFSFFVFRAWLLWAGGRDQYLVPGTWYQVPGTWYQVPGTWLISLIVLKSFKNIYNYLSMRFPGMDT